MLLLVCNSELLLLLLMKYAFKRVLKKPGAPCSCDACQPTTVFIRSGHLFSTRCSFSLNSCYFLERTNLVYIVCWSSHILTSVHIHRYVPHPDLFLLLQHHMKINMEGVRGCGPNALHRRFPQHHRAVRALHVSLNINPSCSGFAN
jgi:hypothetical protein